MATTVLEQVKAYALEHYTDGGWDVIVETFEDDELAEAIGRATTLKGALRKLRPLVEVWNDRQQDAINSTSLAHTQTKTDFDPQPGEIVRDRDGKRAKLVYRYTEDGIDFSAIRYLDGSNPQGLGALDPATGLVEHTTFDRKAMGRDSDYWDMSTWEDDLGLRPDAQEGGDV